MYILLTATQRICGIFQSYASAEQAMEAMIARAILETGHSHWYRIVAQGWSE